jgi:hypothetical protein
MSEPARILRSLPDSAEDELAGLAHAESSSSSKNDFVVENSSSCSSEPEGFAEAVAPLESAAGKKLRGWGRQVCIAAFTENPKGFRYVVTYALDHATINAVGLCIRLCRDGDHRDDAPPPLDPEEERGRRWRERMERLGKL